MIARLFIAFTIALTINLAIQPVNAEQKRPNFLFLLATAKSSNQTPKQRLTNSYGMEFVFIKPGTFTMGSPTNELGRDDDEKLHQVTLTQGIYIQTTEVTQSQWHCVMGSNPSKLKNCGLNCPVENVSWYDAMEFIKNLNRIDSKGQYRLPTEAEWEYAARAGTDTAFANGGISELRCGRDLNLDAIGWYCGNSGETAHPVAQKKPNAWGLYDMHGNVWEWCADWYAEYPSGSVTNPSGPSSGSVRIRRGGSWTFIAGGCRSAVRYGTRPVVHGSIIGFRLAIDP